MTMLSYSPSANVDAPVPAFESTDLLHLIESLCVAALQDDQGSVTILSALVRAVCELGGSSLG